MKSLAIWCNQTNDKIKFDKIDLHINFWKISNDAFIDIGLMLSEISTIKSLNIYFPFEVKKDEILDLGEALIDDNLISAIFNENYSTSSQDQNSKVFVVEDRDQKPPKTVFTLYKIDCHSDIKIKPNQYNGTVICIDINSTNHSGERYFRLRLQSEKVNDLLSTHRPPGSFLEKAFNSIEVLDLRFNEKRILDSSLLEKLQSEGPVKFKSVHFLYLRNEVDDLVYSHTEIATSRRLEPELWKSYIPDIPKQPSIIAYHWKEKVSKDEFNALVKFKQDDYDKKTVAKYLLCAITIGFLASFSGSLVFNLLYYLWS